MPEAKKNISADAKRSILQHLMFGMLGLLILMNWSVYRPIDYQVYNKAFAISERNEFKQQSFYLSIIKDLKEEEALDFQIEMDSIAKQIVKFTDELILQISIFDSSIKAKNHTNVRDSDLEKCDSVLLAVSKYHQEVFKTIGIDTTGNFAKKLPLNRESIEQIRNLIGKKTFPFQNKSVWSIIALLGTLKSDCKYP